MKKVSESFFRRTPINSCICNSEESGNLLALFLTMNLFLFMVINSTITKMKV